jgi:hypothetical protein
MSRARTLLWGVGTSLLAFAVMLPVYMGIDTMMRDSFVKTALQWIVGAILVTLFLGIRPSPPDGGRTPRGS